MAKLIMEVKMQKLHETCLRCGRKLKTEQSKELGFGKVCWEKYNSENTFKQLFPMEGEKCKKRDCPSNLFNSLSNKKCSSK